MKKLFAALIASAFIVPALSTSAFAGDPYPGTVNTSVKVSAPDSVDLGEVFAIKSTLNVASSSPSTCKGKITVVVEMGQRLKARSAAIKGGQTKSFKFALRTEGQWTITSTYKPKAGSPCKGSSKSRSISVS